MKWPWTHLEDEVKSLSRLVVQQESELASARRERDHAEDACRQATAAANQLLAQRDAAPKDSELLASRIEMGVHRVVDRLRRPDPPRLEAGEHVYPCPNPECLSTRPQFTVALLESHVERAGVLVSVVTGRRVSCQACGQVFSIDGQGIFKQHPSALPPTPIYMAPKVNATTESLGDDVAEQIKKRGERARAPDWRQRPNTP